MSDKVRCTYEWFWPGDEAREGLDAPGRDEGTINGSKEGACKRAGTYCIWPLGGMQCGDLKVSRAGTYRPLGVSRVDANTE